MEYSYIRNIEDIKARLKEVIPLEKPTVVLEEIKKAFPDFTNSYDALRATLSRTRNGEGLYNDVWLLFTICKSFGLSMDKIFYGEIKENAVEEMLSLKEDIVELRTLLIAKSQKEKKIADNDTCDRLLKRLYSFYNNVRENESQFIYNFMYSSYSAILTEQLKERNKFEIKNGSHVPGLGPNIYKANLSKDDFNIAIINNITNLDTSGVFASINDFDLEYVSLSFHIDPINKNFLIGLSRDNSNNFVILNASRIKPNLIYQDNKNVKINVDKLKQENKAIVSPYVKKLFSLLQYLSIKDERNRHIYIKPFIESALSLGIFIRVIHAGVLSYHSELETTYKTLVNEFTRFVKFIIDMYIEAESNEKQLPSSQVIDNSRKEMTEILKELNVYFFKDCNSDSFEAYLERKMKGRVEAAIRLNTNKFESTMENYTKKISKILKNVKESQLKEQEEYIASIFE